MTLTLPGIESLSLSVNEEIRVRASLNDTFTALLEQLGPYNEIPDGTPMPMKLEPWPGGRWSRATRPRCATSSAAATRGGRGRCDEGVTPR